jgi:hypothetical protein
MKEYVFALMALVAGCGGSGGGSGTTPAPVPGPGTGLGGDGSQPGGDQTECKSMTCASRDQVRSVLDPNKLVKRCGDGQVMVEDICAIPRALVTEDGVVEFGNVATKGSIYKTDILGQPETPSYIRKFTALGGEDKDYDFEYYIEGDAESTLRWNQPGLLLSDSRYSSAWGEIYFAAPGLLERPLGFDAKILGIDFGGLMPYTTLRDLCSAVASSYKSLTPNYFAGDLPDTFNGQLKQGCSVTSTDQPPVKLRSIALGFNCSSESACVLRSLSLSSGQNNTI